MREKLITIRKPRACTTSNGAVLGAKRGAAWLRGLLNEAGISRERTFQTACLEDLLGLRLSLALACLLG